MTPDPSIRHRPSREDAIREFKEKQKRSRAAIREHKRKLAAALKAGDMAAVRALGPMYK